MDRSLRSEQTLWLLGSLSNLYRIPFDAALVARQFPPARTLASFHAAAHPDFRRGDRAREHGARMGVVSDAAQGQTTREAKE